MSNSNGTVTANGDSASKSLTWTKSPCLFHCGEGHVNCLSSGKMYVFGGVSQHGQELRESNDLFVYDPANPKWTKLNVKGTPPPPRSAAALASVNGHLYLFGGLSQAFGWFDDLYIFDTKKLTWSVLECGGQRPSSRDKLQCVSIGKKIYFFGGFGPKSGDPHLEDDDDDEDSEDIEESNNQDGAEFGWFNDLFIFDTEKKEWSQPMQMNLGVPTARAAHTMSAVGRNIVIFGGRGIETRQNDLHIFNIDTRKWDVNLAARGSAPEPRSFHSAATVDNRVVIFGGRGIDNNHYSDVHIFDVETKEWLRPPMAGDLPCARGQHSITSVGDVVVLCGGSGKFSPDMMQCREHYTDTYHLDTADIISIPSSETTNGENGI